MATPFEVMIQQLTELGFFGFLLPFMLVFVVAYGILSKTKVIGEDKKVQVAASAILAFFVLGFGSVTFGAFFVNLFALGTVVLAAILVILLFVGLVGGDISKLFGGNNMVIWLLVGIGVIIFFLVLNTIGIAISSQVVATIFFVVVLIIAVSFIAGGKG